MSIEIRECDKLRMAALYLQRFPDDHTKLKIVLNDLEGFNIPKSVLDKLKQLFTKPQHSIGYEGSKVSGLEAFFHVRSESDIVSQDLNREQRKPPQ
jgi:hypothetical protein